MSRTLPAGAPRGVIAPALTPFDAEDRVDRGRFREQVRHLAASGVHGISPGGSTGEGAALTDEELAALIGDVREHAPGANVVAGVIRTSTQAAVRTGLAARDAGAEALMVTPVFYNVLVPDDDGNVAFYSTLAERVGLPIVIYNVVPQNEISPALFSRLLDIDEVVGIKQSVGGVLAMYDMRVTCGDRGAVYAATDEMLSTCFSLGADGAISALLSLFPRLSRRMWDLCQEGKHDEALAIQDRLLPVWKVIRGPQFPARMKAATKALGRDLKLCRSPSSPVGPELQATLEKVLVGVVDE